MTNTSALAVNASVFLNNFSHLGNCSWLQIEIYLKIYLSGILIFYWKILRLFKVAHVCIFSLFYDVIWLHLGWPWITARYNFSSLIAIFKALFYTCMFHYKAIGNKGLQYVLRLEKVTDPSEITGKWKC